MQYIITLPDLGAATKAVMVRRMLRQPGDQIRQGEPLLDVSTDRSELKVESFANGYLREWFVEEGRAATSLSAIALLTDTLTETYPGLLSPHSSRLLAGVRDGSPDAVLASKARKPRAQEKSSQPPSGNGRAITAQANYPGRAPSSSAGFTSRTVMAATTTGSKREIPHFYVTIDVSMKHAAEWREDWNLHHPKSHVTFNDLFVMCASRGLGGAPLLRMAYRDGKYEQRTSADILLAVAQEPAFALIPLPDPSKLTWKAFLKSIRKATQMGVIENIDPLLAVSNLGMYGVKEFAAIVPPSCTAILAVGAVREIVTVKNGTADSELVCSLTLSADHRVVNGVAAAQFLRGIQFHLNSL
jgi:pyruvate dehydrogenase E2 component (dihydrolipoamide acetyltransferase)